MVNWLKTTALNWLIVAAVLWFIPKYLHGIVVEDFSTALLVSFVLGCLLSTVKPVLKWMLFPIHALSLGSFSIVLNVLCLFICALFLAGFQITNPMDGILLSLSITLATIGVKLVL